VSMRETNCGYCGVELGQSNFTIDHIIPKSKGGSDSADNRMPACRECNLSKGTKTLEEFRLWASWRSLCKEQGFSIKQLEWLLNNTDLQERYRWGCPPVVFAFERSKEVSQ